MRHLSFALGGAVVTKEPKMGEGNKNPEEEVKTKGSDRQSTKRRTVDKQDTQAVLSKDGHDRTKPSGDRYSELALKYNALVERFTIKNSASSEKDKAIKKLTDQLHDNEIRPLKILKEQAN